MARAFRAEVAEPAAPLPAAHHDQVLSALEDFRSKLAADAVRERAVDHTVGPNEQSAIRVLAAAQAMPNIASNEKALFVAAQHAVRLAKFQDLPRKLNAFQKAVNKQTVTTAAYLDKLLEIIRSYPLDLNEPDSPTSKTPAVDPKQLPQIILSESFTTK
jgi:hypothetical protein